MMAFWIVLLIILVATTVGGVLLALVIATVARKQAKEREAVAAKPKRGAEDPYVDRLAEEGAVWLEDDGELPELVEEDLYLADKPKRTLGGD